MKTLKSDRVLRQIFSVVEMYVGDEIITAASGVRIRVNNTDAEGRFAMGDCLYYMKEEVF